MIRKNLYTIDTLRNISTDLKGGGLKIGLTHGTFDLLHFAHLDLLRTAAQVCDYLIVGVDSDEIVRKFKGEDRPIIGIQQRIEAISSIAYVDAVFVNDQAWDPSSFSKLYRSLMIDVVLVGEHFSFANQVQKQVKDGGAQLVRVKTHQTPSTSSIIEDIVAKHIKETPVIEGIN